MIRALFGTLLTLAVAAAVYFIFIEPNIDDVEDKAKDTFREEPTKRGKEAQSKAERFARCLQRVGANPEALDSCRKRYLK